MEYANMDFNWSALAVAILSERFIPVEEAFARLEGKSLKKSYYTEEDSVDIKKLRDRGMSLPEIHEIYGMSYSTICHRIKRVEKKVASA